jgi:hypothetical protein
VGNAGVNMAESAAARVSRSYDEMRDKRGRLV